MTLALKKHGGVVYKSLLCLIDFHSLRDYGFWNDGNNPKESSGETDHPAHYMHLKPDHTVQ